MKHFNLTRAKDILRLNYYLTFLLLSLALTGCLEYAEKQLRLIIEENPLPYLYFPIFILIGVIPPLIIRYIKRHDKSYLKILNPYLYLLLGQVLNEFFLVFIVGKGTGVIVGFAFTVFRLIQLIAFQSLEKVSKKMDIYIKCLLILWMVNFLQIILNRIIPFVKM